MRVDTRTCNQRDTENYRWAFDHKTETPFAAEGSVPHACTIFHVGQCKVRGKLRRASSIHECNAANLSSPMPAIICTQGMMSTTSFTSIVGVFRNVCWEWWMVPTENCFRQRQPPTYVDATLTQVTGLGISSELAAQNAKMEEREAPRLCPVTVTLCNKQYRWKKDKKFGEAGRTPRTIFIIIEFHGVPGS